MRYHLLEWQVSKRLEISSASKDVEKREPLCTVGRDVNWCSHCGNGMVFPQKKNKNRIKIWSITSTSGHLPEGNKNTILKRYMHHHVHCSIIYNIQEAWKQPQLSSVQFSHSVVSNSLRPHEWQHARPPCPSQTPGIYSNSCPSSWWCHPAILSSVVPFSSCPQSLPASGSFPMSQLFAWGGQSTGVSASASVLPMNTQDWSPLG